MIRVTATMLETFRYYNTSEYATYENLVESLRGTSEPNEAMRFGSAVHKLLELQASDPDYVGTLEMDGYVFDRSSVEEALSWTHDRFVVEVPNHRSYIIDGQEVRLRCKADAVLGRLVVDYKITQSSIGDSKLQSYQDSMQWRAYLSVFDADAFGYSVQQWKLRDGLYVLEDLELVTCHRYLGLDEDVARAVVELYDFCHAHGIADVLYKEDEAYA